MHRLHRFGNMTVDYLTVLIFTCVYIHIEHHWSHKMKSESWLFLVFYFCGTSCMYLFSLTSHLTVSIWHLLFYGTVPIYNTMEDAESIFMGKKSNYLWIWGYLKILQCVHKVFQNITRNLPYRILFMFLYEISNSI